MKGRIVSRQPAVSVIPLHPTTTAGGTFKGGDLPPDGSNDGRESKYVRCRQCGFIANRDRDPKGSGYGNETTKTVSGSVVLEPVVNSGCPFCGSSEYE